jgi:DNA-binding PadR family transcriptional regulator
MRTRTHRTLTPLALAVLDLLHERDMHPYEMQQRIRDCHTDRVIKVRAGSLYHTVERLHRLRLIEPVETARAGRRPERTVYAISDSGRDEFAANLRELVRHPEEEFPLFGAAIVLLHALGPAQAAELLEQRTVALEAALAAGDQIVASLTKRRLPRINIIEIEYAQAMRKAELAWIRDLVDDIRSGALPWEGSRAAHAEETT